MVDVSFSKGNRVLPVRVDRDVVTTHQHRNHRKSLKAIGVSGIVDGLSRLSHYLVGDSVKTIVDPHDEPLETVMSDRTRAVSTLIYRIPERVKAHVSCIEGSARVTHGRTHAIVIDMDHIGGGQLRERSRDPALVRHILKGPLKLEWVLVQVPDPISDFPIAQT